VNIDRIKEYMVQVRKARIPKLHEMNQRWEK
jgi:hypothetical protein